jgi:RNA polymerase sigma-70 factor, ECF subfamily
MAALCIRVESRQSGPMSARDPAGVAMGDASSTLSDVLYANKARTNVLEEEWVALVESVAVGDERALHALYERSHRIVFTLAVRLTNDRATAEEVTLDVFHEIWRRASTYDPANGTVVGWIMNQARSRSIDRLRFEQRKKRVSPDAEDRVPAESANPHRDLELGELSRALREALVVLTSDERQAIEAAYFSELTHVEVAERLNQPLGTIKTRIRSGLAKLRKALAGSQTT